MINRRELIVLGGGAVVLGATGLSLSLIHI